MADEPTSQGGTTTENEATAADFDPEDLITPQKTSSQENTSDTSSESKEDFDEDIDFDPTEEEFEVSVKKEAKPDGKEVQEGEKEVKEKGGSKESLSTDKSSQKSEEKPSDKTPKEKKEEIKSPAPTSKYVKVKIGEDEYEFPEEAYDAISNTVKAAQEIRAKSEELSKNLLEKHSETFLDMLTEAYGGDREKAYQRLLEEYAGVIKRELDFRSLPPEKQSSIQAEEKAKRLESELKYYREREAAREKEASEAKEVEELMTDVTTAMKKHGLDLSDTNKSLAYEAVDQMRILRQEGKNPQVEDVIKYLKQKREIELSEKDKKYEESLDEIPDEELEKRHPKLVERLRKRDIAKLKAGTPTAKTPEKPVEREASARSKLQPLNTEDWDKRWYRR